VERATVDFLGRCFVIWAGAAQWAKPGCASSNLQIKGHPQAPPGVHILGDFLMGEGDCLSGAFIFESGGLLSGLEVYGLVGDAPTTLPRIEDLRPFATGE
jgi:hypothetical protein